MNIPIKRKRELPSYDDACRMLAAMTEIGPVKEIAKQADGIEEYARVSKDGALLEQAIRIRFAATKAIGRIIREMQKRGELIGPTGGRPKKKNPPGGGRVKTLKDLGLSYNESSNAQWLLDLPEKEYDRRVASIVKKMIASLGAVFRQALREERKAALYAKTEITPGLHLGDFRELSPKIIDDESVELVFIDPPYDTESLPLYGAAAEEAKRILKPGGSLITYLGQVILPEVLRDMGKHLKYFWIGSFVHGGPWARMEFTGIMVGSKPFLWFVKDYRGDTQTFVRDTVMGTGREKDFHEWQQAINEADHFIEPLTSNGGCVVDFFAGGGTTLMAAKNLGRSYIGFEIDPKHAARAKERLDGASE